MTDCFARRCAADSVVAGTIETDARPPPIAPVEQIAEPQADKDRGLRPAQTG